MCRIPLGTASVLYECLHEEHNVCEECVVGTVVGDFAVKAALLLE